MLPQGTDLVADAARLERKLAEMRREREVREEERRIVGRVIEKMTPGQLAAANAFVEAHPLVTYAHGCGVEIPYTGEQYQEWCAANGYEILEVSDSDDEDTTMGGGNEEQDGDGDDEGDEDAEGDDDDE